MAKNINPNPTTANTDTADNVLPWCGDPQGCYKIGRLGKPHGVKGELSLQFSDDIFDRVDADYLIVVVDGLPVPFFFEEYRFRSDEVALVKFEGVDSEDEARNLTGCDVYFPRELSDGGDQAPSWAELTGFQVLDAHSGQVVGVATGVDDSTLNTLLEVSRPDGSTALVPLTDDLLERFDREKRTLTLVIPEGLLDL